MSEINIHLEEPLLRQLELRAKKRGVPVDQYIVKTLRWHLRQLKKVEEGLSEQGSIRIDGKLAE